MKPVDRPMNYILGSDVEGWFSLAAASVLLRLAPHLDVAGRPVCEIGVHHGKLLIFLALITEGRAVGYDLFEDQDQNIDKSGHGERRALERNFARHAEASRLRAIQTNSLDLTPERVLADCGAPPVFFSVDGGHTPGITRNDLRVAARAVAEDGVVILDDVYNESFPGVAEGFFAFLREDGGLSPFCIVGNKTLLARSPATAERLRRALDSFTHYDFLNVGYQSDSEILGSPIRIYHREISRNLLLGVRQTAAFHRFRRSKLGGSVLGAWNAMKRAVRAA